MDYKPAEHIVYKALIRPVLYVGLPMELLFIVLVIPFLLGSYFNILIWLLIPILIFPLSLLSKKDPFIFHLLHLKFKTRGNSEVNHFYGASVIFAQQYSSDSLVGITELRVVGGTEQCS